METAKEQPFAIFMDLAESVAQAKWQQLEAKGQTALSPKNTYIARESLALATTYQAECTSWLEQTQLGCQHLEKALQMLPLTQKDPILADMELAKRLWDQTLVTLTIGGIESWNGSFPSLQHSTIAWIYQIGHDFVEKQQFAEALSIFSLLTLLSPKSSDVWVAQGFAQRQLHLLEKSLSSFAIATLLQPDNPLSRLHSAEVYLQLKRPEDALLELEALADIVSSHNLSSFQEPLAFLQTQAKNQQTKGSL